MRETNKTGTRQRTLETTVKTTTIHASFPGTLALCGRLNENFPVLVRPATPRPEVADPIYDRFLFLRPFLPRASLQNLRDNAIVSLSEVNEG